MEPAARDLLGSHLHIDPCRIGSLQGFRLFWTWKIRRGKPGRPSVPKQVRELIRTTSRKNPLWGAPRIHGELLKLGIHIGETSVSKYLVRSRKPPSQTWRTFLENHLQSLVSVDFFVVPTIRFQILYVFLVLAHERRRILHLAVTAHPSAEWTAQQPVTVWVTVCPTTVRPVRFEASVAHLTKAMGRRRLPSISTPVWDR
jgi:hypothetical protein